MHKSAQSFSKLLLAVGAVVLTMVASTVRADDALATLRVGTTTYSNVTVMTKTSTDIFFKHSYGFGNAKVRDVERPTLLQLGYQLPPEEGESKSVFDQSAQSVLESAAVTNLVADPRVQEAQALITAQMGDILEKITPQVIYGFVASVIGLYLFFSFCCRQICVKTGQRANPLIWLPILKQIPLFRAAGMSGWWVIPSVLLFPVAWPLLKIWWAFRIPVARGKSWVVGLLLILPITNVFAFLYLAFSGNGAPEPSGGGNVISLGSPPPPRRAVA
jgi:hypothetical protein